MSQNSGSPQTNSENPQEKNIILFDWLSFSSKIDSVDDLKLLLGLDSPDIQWLEGPGFYRYKHRLYFAGISIHFGLEESPNDHNFVDNIWVDMSGSGCRTFETYSSHKDWSILFSLFLADPQSYHVSRLDVAFDDWSGLLDINYIKKECDRGNIVSVFRKIPVHYDALYQDDLTVYFGSPHSDVRFRIYNKAVERKREDIDHWIRFEIQLRDNSAFRFISELHTYNSIGTVFFGVLKHYLRFVIPSRSDVNKSRWKTRRFWSDFCQSVCNISLYSKKEVDYNLMHLQRYVCDMAGAAAYTYITIKGIDDFMLNIQKKKNTLSKKYLKLINEFKSCSDLRCTQLQNILESSTSIEQALISAEEAGF